MANTGSTGRGVFLPLVLFFLVTIALVLVILLSTPSPRIEAIDPDSAAPGELLRVTGENFGDQRGQSRVELAGQAPTSSSYSSWSDTVVELTIPPGAGSGLLYVVTAGGRSNPVLFTNINSEPVVQGDLSASPRIDAIEPVEVGVSGSVTIYGSRFGRRRGDSQLLFTPLEGGSPSVPVDVASGGYRSWGDEEVRVRVPDGAGNGPIRLVGRQGEAQSEDLTVIREAGRLNIGSFREYALRQEVRFYEFGEGGEGVVRVWLPDAQRSAVQRQVQLLGESQEAELSFQGQASLYTVSPPPPVDRSGGQEEDPGAQEVRLARTFLLRRYEVSAEVTAEEIPREYDLDDAFMRRYTRVEEDLPVEAGEIVAFGRESVGGVTNRLEQGRWIFRESLRLLEPDASGTSDPIIALENGSGSSFAYASLMVSALRSLGVPARPVSGVLLLEEAVTVAHHWVEFFLPGFGWFPADPSLADGLYADRLLDPPSPREEFFFGSLDNRRVAFSYGEIATPSLEMGDGVEDPQELYARLLTFEEASDEMGRYRSRRLLPELIGSY